MGEFAYAPLRLGSRNALARALRPEYIGIKPEDYLDITAEMIELASPDKLRSSLIDVPVKSSGAVGYLHPQSERLLYIAVAPQEYGILGGSVLHLGERAVQNSIKKRQQPQGLSESDAEATIRAGVHAVINRAAKMQQYSENDLATQFVLIKKFQEAAEHPGLARFGKEVEMRKQFNYLRTYTFARMLQTIAGQRHWTPAQQHLAERTIEARIFPDRDHNRHITNFKGMLDLAEEWNGYKRAIVAGRLWQSSKYIKEHGADV